jgi:hypothetical protein
MHGPILFPPCIRHLAVASCFISDKALLLVY